MPRSTRRSGRRRTGRARAVAVCALALAAGLLGGPLPPPRPGPGERAGPTRSATPRRRARPRGRPPTRRTPPPRRPRPTCSTWPRSAGPVSRSGSTRRTATPHPARRRRSAPACARSAPAPSATSPARPGLLGSWDEPSTTDTAEEVVAVASSRSMPRRRPAVSSRRAPPASTGRSVSGSTAPSSVGGSRPTRGRCGWAASPASRTAPARPPGHRVVRRRRRGPQRAALRRPGGLHVPRRGPARALATAARAPPRLGILQKVRRRTQPNADGVHLPG